MIGMRAHDLDYGDIEVLSEKLARYDKHTIQFALLKSVTNVNIKDGSFSPGLARFKEHIKYARFLGADMIGTETGSVAADGLYCDYNHSEQN